MRRTLAAQLANRDFVRAGRSGMAHNHANAAGTEAAGYLASIRLGTLRLPVEMSAPVEILSAKARSRGRLSNGSAAGAMGIVISSNILRRSGPTMLISLIGSSILSEG